MKHTKKTREVSHQTEEEVNDSPLSEDSISGSEDEGLARHVWDSYTNSQSQFNLIKEKVLEKVASPRLPLTPGNKKTADTKHVEVTQVEGTKGLKKSSGENHGRDACLETEDPESLVTMIGRVFGSKVWLHMIVDLNWSLNLTTPHLHHDSYEPGTLGQLQPRHAASLRLLPAVPRPPGHDHQGGVLC